MAHIAGYGYDAHDLADIETAVGEALANAVEHGHREGSTFEVHVFADRAHVVIEVQDDGAGFAASHPRDNPGYDAPRGFGIFLMRHLMDRVDYSNNGTRVRLAKRLPLARENGISAV